MIDLGSAIGRIAIDAADALKATGGLGRALGGLAGPAGMMAAGIATGAAAAGGALIALGASSVGVARDFQSSMAIMSTAVDPASLGVESTAQAMGILGDAALAVGSDTALVGVSASSSAEAITGLYKAGLSTTEIFGDLQGYMAGTAELSGALRASVDLAAASELDMVAASELAAITLATFGGHLETEAERAEFINSAMNNFVQTADASVASVGDLQAAFVNVGPSAAAMGLGVEDVNVALGILSTRGITGSEAGTALKSMLVNLQRTTPEVTGTLDALGVSLYDAQGVMYSMPEIIGQLQGAMAGMTDEQRQQTVVTLAGSYGMNAMNALLGEGTEGWAAMETAVGNAATMQETAAARANTLDGAMEALGGVAETFRIKVGTALIPVLTSLADIGATLLEKYGPTMTAMFESVGNGIGRIIEVVSGQLGELFTVFEDGSSVLGSIFEAFGMGEEAAARLATGISNIVTTVQNALGPIVQAVTQFVSWKDVLVGLGLAIATVVIPAVASIALSVASFMAPILAVIGVVALLRNAWENNWGGIQEKVAAVVAFITPLFETIKGAIGGFMSNLQEGMSPLNAFIEAIWGIVPQPVLDALVNLRDNILPALSVTFQTVWGIIQTVIGTAVEAIRPAIETIMTTVQGAGTRLSGLVGPLQDLWAKVGPFIQAAATIIGAILVGLVGVIVGIVNGIANALDPLIDTFVNLAENIIQIVGGIIDFLTGFFNLLIGLVTGNGDKVKAAFSQMWEGVKSIVEGLVKGVWELFSGLVETVATLIDGFITGIIDFFQNLYDELVGHSIVPDLIESIVTWFENLITWIAETLSNLWDAVSQPFIEMWADLTAWFGERVADAIQLGRNIVQGLIDGVRAMGTALRGALEGIVNAAINAIKALLGIASPSTLMYEIGVNTAQGLINGIRSKITDAAEAMSAIFEAMGNVSGIAGSFGSQFEQQVLDPMRRGIAAMEDQMADWDDSMAAIVEQLGYGPGFLMDPGAVLELNRLINYEYATQQQKDQARVLLAFMRERNRMQLDYIELQRQLAAEERRLAALQEKQQQNAFLQEQLKLLEFFRKNNLSTSILDGLVLGLNADAGAIMDAMRHALEQMIAVAQNELGIASPSKVFRGIGEQVNRGLLMGLSDNRPVIAAMRDTMDSIAARAYATVIPAASNGKTAHLYGGQHFYFERPGRNVLDDVQVLLAP